MSESKEDFNSIIKQLKSSDRNTTISDNINGKNTTGLQLLNESGLGLKKISYSFEKEKNKKI